MSEVHRLLAHRGQNLGSERLVIVLHHIDAPHTLLEPNAYGDAARLALEHVQSRINPPAA